MNFLWNQFHENFYKNEISEKTLFLYLVLFFILYLFFTETELFLKLQEHANTLVGADAYCFKAFAEALEVIPYTLAENAGLNPISTVTELRNKHAQGEVNRWETCLKK